MYIYWGLFGGGLAIGFFVVGFLYFFFVFTPHTASNDKILKGIKTRNPQSDLGSLAIIWEELSRTTCNRIPLTALLDPLN